MKKDENLMDENNSINIYIDPNIINTNEPKTSEELQKQILEGINNYFDSVSNKFSSIK